MLRLNWSSSLPAQNSQCTHRIVRNTEYIEYFPSYLSVKTAGFIVPSNYKISGTTRNIWFLFRACLRTNLYVAWKLTSLKQTCNGTYTSTRCFLSTSKKAHDFTGILVLASQQRPHDSTGLKHCAWSSFLEAIVKLSSLKVWNVWLVYEILTGTCGKSKNKKWLRIKSNYSHFCTEGAGALPHLNTSSCRRYKFY